MRSHVISKTATLALTSLGLLLALPAFAAGGGNSGYVSDAPVPWHMETNEAGDNVIALIDHAKERLDLQTVAVTGPENKLGIKVGLSVPYQSLIYWADGTTWVYGLTEEGDYSRMEIVVDYIKDDWVALKKGPAPGTMIVTIGAAELFGAETGTGH